MRYQQKFLDRLSSIGTGFLVSDGVIILEAFRKTKYIFQKVVTTLEDMI